MQKTLFGVEVTRQAGQAVTVANVVEEEIEAI
jgi:hypothetical protein